MRWPHSQSNGQAERYEQTEKNMLKKVHEQNQDPYLALLEYRNISVVGMKYSPAQMLMSRRLRTKILCGYFFGLTQGCECFCRPYMQTHQKRCYNPHSKSLPPLERGDVACDRRKKMWNKNHVLLMYVMNP